MDNQNFGKEVFTKSFDPDLIHGWGKRTYNWEMGDLGAAGTGAARRPHGRLLPPLVRQLLHRGQPADDDGRLHAVQHPDSGRSAAARRRWRHGDWARTTSCRRRSGAEDLYSQLSSNFGEMNENWHGVDVERQRAAAQRPDRAGRHEPGRRLQDNCAVRAALPETYSWASTAAVQTTRVTTSTGRLANPVLPRGRAVP